MKSATTRQFWKSFDRMPEHAKRLAETAFARWQTDPDHPGLQFKPLRGFDGVYSVRIGLGWRAIGRRRDNTIYWIWIGSHAEYDGFLRHD